MLCQNKLGEPLFFIAFWKCSKHNYQLDQVLENFKYSLYFDGITLRELRSSDVAYEQALAFGGLGETGTISEQEGGKGGEPRRPPSSQSLAPPATGCLNFNSPSLPSPPLLGSLHKPSVCLSLQNHLNLLCMVSDGAVLFHRERIYL